MDNVLPFPTSYVPTIQELERLEGWQRCHDTWKAELYREQRLKRMAPGEAYISKLRYHSGMRDHWKVYTGFKEIECLLSRG